MLTRRCCSRAAAGGRLQAFTLVELLVVVGIIALLISMLLPALGRARDQARMTKCLAHIRGLGQAGQVFAESHNGLFQLATSQGVVDHADPARTRFAYGSDPHQPPGTTAQELLAWPVALAKAAGFPMKNNWDWGVRATSFQQASDNKEGMETGFDLPLCPSDKIGVGSPFFPRNESAYGAGLIEVIGDDVPSPVERMAYWGRLSYGINEDIAGGDGADLDLWRSCWRAVDDGSGNISECLGGKVYGPSSPCFRSGAGYRLRGHLDRVYAPASVGLIFETGASTVTEANSGAVVNLVNSHANDSWPQNNGPYLGNFQQSKTDRVPTNRHRDQRMSVAFADMHAEAVAPVEFSKENDAQKDLPSKYAPRVRVSPYKTHGLHE